jgi:hypothetical protein
MWLRHFVILAVLLVGALALGAVPGLPPLLDTLRFTLVIAILVVMMRGVARMKADLRAKRRQVWQAGAALFSTGTLAIAITQPMMGADSPDAVILGYGLGVVAVFTSYILLLPVALDSLSRR